MSDPLATDPEPSERAGWRPMLPTLLFDVALPILIFYGLSRAGAPTLWALVAGGLSPALNNLRIWIAARRIEPLGIIVMSFLAVGTALSLITGSVFVALIKDSFLTATFGGICLGSLFARRPLMFYITRQFAAGNDPSRIAWWNGLWEYPRFRAAQRRVTAVWGVAYLAEAALRVGFALLLTPAQVVTVSPVMTFGVLILLISWTRRHLLALREQRLSERQQDATA